MRLVTLVLAFVVVASCNDDKDGGGTIDSGDPATLPSYADVDTDTDADADADTDADADADADPVHMDSGNRVFLPDSGHSGGPFNSDESGDSGDSAAADSADSGDSGLDSAADSGLDSGDSGD